MGLGLQVDLIGVGGPVKDLAKRDGIPVRGINVSERSEATLIRRSSWGLRISALKCGGT